MHGEMKICFEDVNQGDKAPALSHTLTRTDLVQYAGASGDFNPMHHDDTKAKAAGLPSVFGHGMFSMGLLATALTNHFGIGNLTEFNVRFAKQTWPDDVLTTEVVVKAKRNEGDKNLVDCDVKVNNQNGEAVVAGEATAALPSRVD
jgi:acyl dehydratase